MKRAFVCGALWIVVSTMGGATEAAADRWWFGGGVGLGFGDVDYVTIEPMVGFRATEKVSVGGGLIFRYRSDDRFTPSFSTTDYGANTFLRYYVHRPVFLQVEYEHLSYERLLSDGTMDRDGYDSLFGGAGFSRPMGDRSAFFVTVLYNFLYDSNEPAPYDEAWALRLGVSFGF